MGLDALEPRVLDELVSDAIERRMDPALYDEAIAEKESDRGLIQLSAASVRRGPRGMVEKGRHNQREVTADHAHSILSHLRCGATSR